MLQLLAACLLLAGSAGVASAAAPSLPFTQESDSEEYLIRFTNQGSHAFPISQAQDAADALDRSGNDVPGNPKGYHDGYVDLGFLEPYFSGNRVVDFWNCKNDADTPLRQRPGDARSGSACRPRTTRRSRTRATR